MGSKLSLHFIVLNGIDDVDGAQSWLHGINVILYFSTVTKCNVS